MHRPCLSRARPSGPQSSGAATPNDAEVVVRTGQGRRSVDMLEACIEDSETSDDDTVKACGLGYTVPLTLAAHKPPNVAQTAAARLYAEGNSCCQRRPASQCQHHDPVFETKRGKGESPSACVTVSEVAKTCQQDSRTDSMDNKDREELDGEESKLREKGEAIADLDVEAAQREYQSHRAAEEAEA